MSKGRRWKSCLIEAVFVACVLAAIAYAVGYLFHRYVDALN